MPPRDWPVTEEGRRAAERLARDPIWRELAYVSRRVPRARRSRRPGRSPAPPSSRRASTTTCARWRASFPSLPRAKYVELVTRWLGGEDVPGFEPREHAARRFAVAVDRVAAASPGPAAVVTHGLVLALHLGLSPDEWAALPLPGIAAVLESPDPGYQRATP